MVSGYSHATIEPPRAATREITSTLLVLPGISVPFENTRSLRDDVMLIIDDITTRIFKRN